MTHCTLPCPEQFLHLCEHTLSYRHIRFLQLMRNHHWLHDTEDLYNHHECVPFPSFFWCKEKRRTLIDISRTIWKTYGEVLYIPWFPAFYYSKYCQDYEDKYDDTKDDPIFRLERLDEMFQIFRVIPWSHFSFGDLGRYVEWESSTFDMWNRVICVMSKSTNLFWSFF